MAGVIPSWARCPDVWLSLLRVTDINRTTRRRFIRRPIEREDYFVSEPTNFGPFRVLKTVLMDPQLLMIWAAQRQQFFIESLKTQILNAGPLISVA